MDSVSPAETHLGTHLSSIPQGNDLSPSLVFMLPDRLSVASPTPTVRGRDCTTEDLRDLKQGRRDRAASRSETLSQESMSCLMELSLSALVGHKKGGKSATRDTSRQRRGERDLGLLISAIRPSDPDFAPKFLRFVEVCETRFLKGLLKSQRDTEEGRRQREGDEEVA